LHIDKIYVFVSQLWASQVALVVKNPPGNAGNIKDLGSILGLGRPLEEVMATQFSMLAWRTPWTKKPGSYRP